MKNNKSTLETRGAKGSLVILKYFLFIFSGIMVISAFFTLNSIYVLKIQLKPQFYALPIIIGGIFGFLIAKFNIMSNQLKEKSILDPLTGLFNRHWLHSFLSSELNRSARYKQDISLILFDIDNFRKVNDGYGHHTGDLIIEEIASLVKLSCRDSDLCARWGGEEFIILLPNTNLDGAKILADRIRLSIENYNFPGPNTVTCSFGLTEFKADSDTELSLLERANKALVEAKNNGKNCIEMIA